jgi:hypothetical protein
MPKPDQLYLDTLLGGETDGAPRPSDMSSCHEQRSCADLHRMIADGELELRPPWQRKLVWGNEGKTRFIDSLARMMPIPSVMVCHDLDTGNRYVIDGLQRLSTILQYFTDTDWAFADSPDVVSSLRGKLVGDVRSRREPHRTIINQSIPVTVITYRSSNKSHEEYLFSIFHRVNSGSVRLNSQEIRNAIYQGRFNEMLKRCDENLAWRAITRRPDEDDNDRYTYREVILRSFALVDRSESFKGTLNTFLNNYMADMKNTPSEQCRMREAAFEEAASLLLRDNLINGELHAMLSDAAVKLETLCYGLLRHHNRLSRLGPEKLSVLLKSWSKGESLQPKALSNKLYGRESLKARLAWTDQIFGDIRAETPLSQPAFI